MKAPTNKVTPRTLDLRDRLKSIVESELERLPELLNGLKDRERLDVILKLMPIVIPKTQSVYYSANEPRDWS